MATAEEQATALKNEGNKAFANHDWLTAIDSYTKAIELDPKVPAYYSNRAQVFLRYIPFTKCCSCD
jgi:serine/threonine-protein phosphatase 5